jgi:hypothetical protein
MKEGHHKKPLPYLRPKMKGKRNAQQGRLSTSIIKSTLGTQPTSKGVRTLHTSDVLIDEPCAFIHSYDIFQGALFREDQRPKTNKAKMRLCTICCIIMKRKKGRVIEPQANEKVDGKATLN